MKEWYKLEIFAFDPAGLEKLEKTYGKIYQR
jgi:hypothetical protein